MYVANDRPCGSLHYILLCNYVCIQYMALHGKINPSFSAIYMIPPPIVGEACRIPDEAHLQQRGQRCVDGEGGYIPVVGILLMYMSVSPLSISACACICIYIRRYYICDMGHLEHASRTTECMNAPQLLLSSS